MPEKEPWYVELKAQREGEATVQPEEPKPWYVGAKSSIPEPTSEEVEKAEKEARYAKVEQEAMSRHFLGH